MIRVLQIMSWGLRLGMGVDTTVMNHYRKIDREKVQFDFLLPKKAENDYYVAEALSLGARVYFYPSDRIGGNKNLRQMAWLVRFLRKHPELKIVHLHHLKPKVYIEAFLMLLAGVPVRIIHSRSDLTYKPGWEKQKISQYMLRTFATHLFACSTKAAVSMFGAKVTKSRKFRVLLNARELEVFRFRPEIRNETRQKEKLEDKYVLINIGGLREQKNQEFLLEAFALAYADNADMILLIAGDGKLRDELEHKAKQLCIANAVRFLGLCDDVNDLLQAADLLVFPSLYEGLSAVTIEAQTSGLPCLISDTVTHECKVTDNVEFLPIDKGPEIWAERILSYSKRSVERIDTLEQVRSAGYDITDAAKRLEEFYLDVLNLR